MTDCVVGPIVGRVFVIGQYTGYGTVDIPVEGEKKQVLLKQFEENFTNDDPVPIVTDIYCDGNESGGTLEYFRRIAMQRNALLGIGDSLNPEDPNEQRICVPNKLKVADELTAAQYAQALNNTKKRFRAKKIYDAVNATRIRKAEQKEGTKKRAKVVVIDGDKKPKAKPSAKKSNDVSPTDC